MKRVLLTAIGFIFLALGAVGAFLPIWPTTPFILLSAACFSRAPKLRSLLLRVPFFREHIENYKKRTGLSRRTLALSLTFLWGMLSLSMLLSQKPWALAVLPLIGCAVTAHLLYMARGRRGKGDAEG